MDPRADSSRENALRYVILSPENSRLNNRTENDNGNEDDDDEDYDNSYVCDNDEGDEVASSRCSIVMNYRCVAENREQRDASRADEVGIGGSGRVQLRGISRCTFLPHGFSLRDDERRR